MAASAIDLARALGQGKGIERPRRVRDPGVAHALLGRRRQGQRRPVHVHRLQVRRPAAGARFVDGPGCTPHRATTTRRTSRMAQPQEQSEGPRQASRRCGVGMVGYAFMGAAHSQGWRTAGRVFDLPCTRCSPPSAGGTRRPSAPPADRLGWAAAETDWRALIARDDVDLVDICTPGDSHAEIAARRAGRGQARAVREAPRQHRRGGRGDDPGRRRRPGPRPGGDGRLQLPPGARHRAGPADGRRGPPRHAAARTGDVPSGLAGGPGVPADLAAAQGDRPARARSATWARTSSTSRSTWRGSRWPGSPR